MTQTDTTPSDAQTAIDVATRHQKNEVETASNSQTPLEPGVWVTENFWNDDEDNTLQRCILVWCAEDIAWEVKEQPDGSYAAAPPFKPFWATWEPDPIVDPGDDSGDGE